MESIEIRPYAEKDQEAVIRLILSIQQDEFGIPISLTDQPDLLKIAEVYQQGSGNFWVALHAGSVVGTISLIDIGSRQGALRKMFVDSAFRGSDFLTANKLLQGLLKWAAAHELEGIYLGTTEKFLAAHRFYEKNGFQRIEKQELPPSFPVMRVDTRFYKWEFDAAGAE